MTSVIVICGSLRKVSWTRELTDIAYNHAKKVAEADYLDLSKADVEWFRGWEESYGAETREAVKRVTGADVLVIGSPIYDGLLGSPLKNLFEHIEYKSLEGKVAGFIIKSGSQISALQVQGQLVALMNYFRVVSNPRAVYAFDEHFEARDRSEKSKLKDKEIERRVKQLVDETIAMFRPKKASP
jgi:NAD(P)H-dependent FMN reductase